MKTETVKDHLTFKSLITVTKALRNFNAESYIENKIKAINNFFAVNSLDSAVLGISGGIDSAVVFALLSEASKINDSPLKKVVGLLLPIKGSGTSNQDNALERGKLLSKYHSDNVKLSHVNLTNPFEYYVMAGRETTDWAQGQLASIVRTPFLYYEAAMLQSEGFKSLVVGTTNRDEGSYIGFFGKASDAMVDLQPIADIHKSEVYQIAKILGVPQDIIDATPAGDVYDSRVDEEMIGAPYWFLEMYLLMKEYNILQFSSRLSDEYTLYQKYSSNIENLHRINSHKYKVGSPAHFIDVVNRSIPGGW